MFDRVFQHAVHVHVETFQRARELLVSALHDDPNFLVDAFVDQLGGQEERGVVLGGRGGWQSHCYYMLVFFKVRFEWCDACVCIASAKTSFVMTNAFRENDSPQK